MLVDVPFHNLPLQLAGPDRRRKAMSLTQRIFAVATRFILPPGMLSVFFTKGSGAVSKIVPCAPGESWPAGLPWAHRGRTVHRSMFEGTFTALVTPFVQDHLDEAAFMRLIEEQIRSGITGVVPVGTTGESPTLDHEEHHRVIALAVEAVAGRCKVIAGTGSNSTREAVDLTVKAESLGADAALIVAPYYNKPTQAGLLEHYGAIASAVKIPIMLYSIPGRCGIEIGVETVAALAQRHSNIVAIKESGGSVERVSQLRAALPASFEILSGDDSLTLPFMSVGACGVVSVASNIVPARVGQMVAAALAGDYGTARKIHFELYPLFKELFVESNPAPTKYALSILGRMHPEVRPPLASLAASSRGRVETAMRQTGLL